MAKRSLFVYECICPPDNRGHRGFVEIPFMGPMNPNEWVDQYTPKFGLHVLRLEGPYQTVDRYERVKNEPGQLIVTRRPVGKHLTHEHSKMVSRPRWATGGNPTHERYRLPKVVKPKLRLLEEDEAAEVLGECLFPAGENFRRGKPFATEKCTWAESLFVDACGDVEPTAEMKKLARGAIAMLADGIPEGGVPEPMEAQA